MRYLTLFLILILTTTSCENDFTESDHQGMVKFSLSSLGDSQGRTNEIPASFLVTIADETDSALVLTKQLEVFEFGDGYISEVLELNSGDYELVQFIVLDENDQALFASPLEDSPLSEYVDRPLPIDFSINETSSLITTISPEVVSVANTVPEDFGMVSFGIEVVETFDIQAGAFIFKDGDQQMASALMTVDMLDENGNTKWTKQFNLLDNYTSIKLKGGGHSYRFSAVKEGYKPQERTYSYDSLIDVEESVLSFYLGPDKLTLAVDMSSLNRHDSALVTLVKNGEVIIETIEHIENGIGYLDIDLSEGNWDVQVNVINHITHSLSVDFYERNGITARRFYTSYSSISVEGQSEISIGSLEWTRLFRMLHNETGILVLSSLDDLCNIHTSINLNGHEITYGYADAVKYHTNGELVQYLFTSCTTGGNSFCGLSGQNIFDPSYESDGYTFTISDNWLCEDLENLEFVDQLVGLDLADGRSVYFYNQHIPSEATLGGRLLNNRSLVEIIEYRATKKIKDAY